MFHRYYYFAVLAILQEYGRQLKAAHGTVAVMLSAFVVAALMLCGVILLYNGHTQHKHRHQYGGNYRCRIVCQFPHFFSLFLESQSFVFLNDVDYKVADFFAAVDYFHIEQSADILVTVFLYVFDVLLAEVCTQAVDSFFDLE